jgi:hypothetical protein
MSAFAPVSVEFPADVLVSFLRPYASKGFEIPGGANGIASAGFHGAMDALASTGVVLTQERDVPPVMRSDSFLTLFPRMHAHLLERDAELHDVDSMVELDYSVLTP